VCVCGVVFVVWCVFLGLLNNYSLINWNHPLMIGLINRWKVIPNRIGGSRLVDLTGRNHGTLNGPTWSSPRTSTNGSLNFSATGANVNVVGYSKDWTALTGATLAVWGYFRAFVNSNALIGFANGGTGNFILGVNSTPRIDVQWRTSTGGTSANGTTTGLVANKWVRLVAVMDCNAGQMRAYLDGKPVWTAALTGTGVGTAVSNVYGMGALFGGNSLDAKLDDGMFWTKALSDKEVSMDFQVTSQKYDPTLNYYNPNLRPISYSNFLLQYNNLPNYLGLNILNGL